MNWELFAAFLLITMILVVTPGPIVTLVIATGASQGVRAALVTVAGTTLGNALLIAGIALGLSWVLDERRLLFEVLRWAGAAYLIWLGIQAWRSAGNGGSGAAAERRKFRTRRLGGDVAIQRPSRSSRRSCRNSSTRRCRPAGSSRHVHGLGRARGAERLRLGGRGRAWPRLVHQAGTRASCLARLSGLALIGGGVWLSLARRPA